MIRASINITALSAVISLISFASQLAIAHAFGADLAFDAYLVAASGPTVAAGLLAATMSFSLQPELARLAPEPAQFRAFASRIFRHLSLLLLVLMLAGFWSAPFFLELMGEGLPANLVADTVTMVRLSWVGSGLMILSSYIGLILTALKRFYWPVSVTAFPYLAVLLVALSLAPQFGVLALPWATIGGAGIACAVLLLKTRPYLGAEPMATDVSRSVMHYYRNIPWALAAMSCFSTYPLIDAAWAPELGAGTLSVLGYGQRVLIAVGGLMIVGPASVLVSLMAEISARHGEDAARARLLHTVKVAIAIGAGVAMVVGVLAHPAIQLVFERGAFDARATQKLADLLPTLLVGMPPMLGCVILFRGMFQLGLARTAAGLGLCWTVAYAGSSGVLSQIHGALGIAEAYALSWWLIFALGLGLVLAASWRADAPSWAAFMTVCLGSAAGAGSLMEWAGRKFTPFAGSWDLGSVFTLFLHAGAGLALYVLVYGLMLLVPGLRAAGLWSGALFPLQEHRHG